jgi:YD repeat-containing protein
MAVKYGIKGNIPQGEMLVSSEYGFQTLRNQGNEWIRERDGITQYFDKEGHLVKQKERTGFVFEFKYAKSGKSLLSEIFSPNNGTSMRFTWKGDRVIEVVDNKSRRARYSYDGAGNLTQSIDSLGQVFIYKYDNKKFPHLITRVEYPNESKVGQLLYREIKYDENGLVIFHKDKDGSETTYSYGRKPNDPDNNFWTKTVTKTARGSEEVYDEYFIRNRTDGSKYLYKQESKINGALVTTLFAPCCGKPLQIMKNGEVTNFKYYENGLLAEKVGPNEEIKLEYDPRWKKVTKVVQNGTTSEYVYDEMGNLSLASNDKKDKVKLKYDRYGRISEMTDNQKRIITFQYGDGSKPTLISQKNLGSIKITYDGAGRVVKAETLIAKEQKRRPTELKSQEVVKQVMSGFQHLLDILRPAGVNLSAG